MFAHMIQQSSIENMVGIPRCVAMKLLYIIEKNVIVKVEKYSQHTQAIVTFGIVIQLQ